MEEETDKERRLSRKDYRQVLGREMEKSARKQSEPPIPELTPEIRCRLLQSAQTMSTGYKLDIEKAYKQLIDLFLDYLTGTER